MESLLEQVTINASDMLLQREVEMMREQQEQSLRNQRMDMDTYLSYMGKTPEEFEEELRPNAHALDDEFAQGVGEGHETFEALQTHIRERVTEEAQSQADREPRLAGVLQSGGSSGARGGPGRPVQPPGGTGTRRDYR